MSSKIQKTIARQQEKYTFFHSACVFTDWKHYRITTGAYYEAHQQLRVIASRYVKARDWASAIDVLFHGAVSLLRAGQGGSGGDLACYLLEVYGKGEVTLSKDEKGKYSLVARWNTYLAKAKVIRQVACWSCWEHSRGWSRPRRNLLLRWSLGLANMGNISTGTRNCTMRLGACLQKVWLEQPGAAAFQALRTNGLADQTLSLQTTSPMRPSAI